MEKIVETTDIKQVKDIYKERLPIALRFMGSYNQMIDAGLCYHVEVDGKVVSAIAFSVHNSKKEVELVYTATLKEFGGNGYCTKMIYRMYKDYFDDFFGTGFKMIIKTVVDGQDSVERTGQFLYKKLTSKPVTQHKMPSGLTLDVYDVDFGLLEERMKKYG